MLSPLHSLHLSNFALEFNWRSQPTCYGENLKFAQSVTTKKRVKKLGYFNSFMQPNESLFQIRLLIVRAFQETNRDASTNRLKSIISNIKNSN